MRNEVPIYHKIALTVSEAAAYSGIGENTLRAIIKKRDHRNMLIKVGSKALIKRTALEEFVAKVEKIDTNE